MKNILLDGMLDGYMDKKSIKPSFIHYMLDLPLIKNKPYLMVTRMFSFTQKSVSAPFLVVFKCAKFAYFL